MARWTGAFLLNSALASSVFLFGTGALDDMASEWHRVETPGWVTMLLLVAGYALVGVLAAWWSAYGTSVAAAVLVTYLWHSLDAHMLAVADGRTWGAVAFAVAAGIIASGWSAGAWRLGRLLRQRPTESPEEAGRRTRR